MFNKFQKSLNLKKKEFSICKKSNFFFYKFNASPACLEFIELNLFLIF